MKSQWWGIRNKEEKWYTGRDRNRIALFDEKSQAVPFSLGTAKELAKELVEERYEILDISPLD